MQRVGIIDLGSNTVRLVVFGVEKRFSKKLKTSQFREILNEKTVAGLSSYVANGVFTDAGVERAVDVLKDHLKSAGNVNCKEVRIFATAVLRNCTNSAEALQAIEEATGLAIDLISGKEEAHLGFVGASIHQKMDQGILVDIGGGSTEVTHLGHGRDLMSVSLRQGSVSAYADLVSLVLPTPQEAEQIRQAFVGELASHESIRGLQEKAMYGIGGSVRAVAKMLGRMGQSDKALKRITPKDVDEVLKLLERDPSTFAHLAVKAAPDRVHSLVPGCIILRELMRSVGTEVLTVSKYGVREGYLLERVLA